MIDLPPMDHPGMLFLLAIQVQAGFTTADGTLRVTMNGMTLGAVPSAALDDVEQRGWLDLSAETPRVTESGDYWMRKWFEKRFAKRLSRRTGGRR